MRTNCTGGGAASRNCLLLATAAAVTGVDHGLTRSIADCSCGNGTSSVISAPPQSIDYSGPSAVCVPDTISRVV